MIKALTQHIDDNVASLTVGTNLFANFRPDTVDTCVLVQEAGGVDDFYSPGLSSVGFSVITRGTSTMGCRDLAREVHAVVNRMIGVTLPTVDSGEVFLVNTARTLAVPEPAGGQDARGRFEYAATYLLETETL